MRFWSLPPKALEDHRLYFVALPHLRDGAICFGQYNQRIVRVALTEDWRRTLVHEIGHLYCWEVLKLSGDPEHRFEPVWKRAETDTLLWG